MNEYGREELCVLCKFKLRIIIWHTKVTYAIFLTDLLLLSEFCALPRIVAVRSIKYVLEFVSEMCVSHIDDNF